MGVGWAVAVGDAVAVGAAVGSDVMAGVGVIAGAGGAVGASVAVGAAAGVGITVGVGVPVGAGGAVVGDAPAHPARNAQASDSNNSARNRSRVINNVILRNNYLTQLLYTLIFPLTTNFTQG